MERRRPKIVITLADPNRHSHPEQAAIKNELYAAGVERHGGDPIRLDERASPEDRRAAFAAMNGLLLSGGADIEPARYGQDTNGALSAEPERDGLEVEAWDAASRRGLPVLGICRGLQAINVFSGGSLVQHVEGHEDDYFGPGPALTHHLRLVPGTMLARILSPTNARGGVLPVNSYHHQGVRAIDLAPGLIASAWSSSPAGDLVEGLERADRGRFVLGVQCHPERTESTPEAFERLWSFFVDACRARAMQARGGTLSDR